MQNKIPFSNTAKYQIFQWYLWITLVLCGAAISCITTCYGFFKTEKTGMLTILGVPFAFLFFVQKQKTQEAELLRELFKGFGDRYEYLKNDLHRITAKNSLELTYSDQDTLESYINLCAEEYLFMTLGHIPAGVWKSWENGMKVHFLNDHLIAAWIKNADSESYYGFSPPVAVGFALTLQSEAA